MIVSTLGSEKSTIGSGTYRYFKNKQRYNYNDHNKTTALKSALNKHPTRVHTNIIAESAIDLNTIETNTNVDQQSLHSVILQRHFNLQVNDSSSEIQKQKENNKIESEQGSFAKRLTRKISSSFISALKRLQLHSQGKLKEMRMFIFFYFFLVGNFIANGNDDNEEYRRMY